MPDNPTIEELKELIMNNLDIIKDERVVFRSEVNTLTKFLSYKHIITMTGLRRSGKTYLMYYLIKKLLNEGKKVLYINFDDPIFYLSDYKVFNNIHSAFLELFNPTKKERVFFFFDEIQNIKGWERWLSSRYDFNIKFFVSGSNSRLLGKEYSHKLTGRHKNITVYPLSFMDVVRFHIKNFEKNQEYVKRIKSRIKTLLQEYLRYGGLPEVVFEGNKEVLSDYVNDIITKDIIVLNNVKYKEALKEVVKVLLTNISSLHTLNSLNKVLNSKNLNTIKNYVSYIENSFLIFTTKPYVYSVRKQQKQPFKVYAYDLGLRNTFSFDFSENKGKLMENLVAIELKRRNLEFYYWKSRENYEIDFVVKEKAKVKELIQVTGISSIEELDKREIRALLHGVKQLHCKNITVITDDLETEESFKWFGAKARFKFIPLWKWLLN